MEELNIREAVDYGVIVYENSNAKSIFDAPSGKIGAKGWAQRIYILLLGVVMLGWFLFSLINAATDPEIGVGKAILRHIAPLILLAMAELILILTAFNAWGKFARGVFRHKGLTRQHGIEGVKTRQLEEELKQADANKAKEYAVRIYRDYIVVVNAGEETVIDRSKLQRVICNQISGGCKLTFCMYDDTQVAAEIFLPIADIPLIKKHFDNFEYTPAPREKGYFKKKIPMMAVAMIPMLIGVALLILRSLVLHGMPIIFGIVFSAFGVIFMVAQFSDVAVIGHGIMGILGGLLLVGLPLGIAFTIIDLVESISFTTVLTTFTVFHAVFSVFLGFGPLLMILGIFGIIDCTKL